MNPELGKALPPLLLFGTLVGACAGAVVHLLAARFARRAPESRGLVIDCCAGAIAFLAAVAAVMFIPVPARTDVRETGGLILRTTTHRLRHPYPIALALSLFVPSTIELIRSRTSRRRPPGPGR